MLGVYPYNLARRQLRVKHLFTQSHHQCSLACRSYPIAGEQALPVTKTIVSGQSSPQDPISVRERAEVKFVRAFGRVELRIAEYSPVHLLSKRPVHRAVPPSTSGFASLPNLAQKDDPATGKLSHTQTWRSSFDLSPRLDPTAQTRIEMYPRAYKLR